MNKHHLLYNIITLKYNIIEYREIRKEDRAMQDGFTDKYMDCKKELRLQ